MVETLTNLQHVYAKWEGRNPYKAPGSVIDRRPLAPLNMPGQDYDKMMASGRDVWRKRYKTTNPQVPFRRNKAPMNKGGIPALSAAEAMSSSLGHFKSSPTVFPAPRTRPFSAHCCACMPGSKGMFYHDGIQDSGFRNILQVNTSKPECSWFTRTFCHYTFITRTRSNFKYPDVSLAVLTSPRLIEAVHKTVLESAGVDCDDDSPAQRALLKKHQKKVQSRAKRTVKRMAAAMSVSLLRLTAWFLHKLLGRLLSSIVVHRGQMAMLKQACQRDVPVMFLPTHRSHLDYILITFILFHYEIVAPHVAAGDNLLIPVFGALMRGLGGYFIRRKLDKQGCKDHVYRAVLQTYMEELLKRHQNFEFFVEGGRTRSGKAIYPKGGLLSVIVDSFNEKVIPDVYIVPISISYEKILDGNFCREQMGEPKRHETFWRAVVAIWKVAMSHFGSVRVDFSQPFSLKEYIQVSQHYRSSSLAVGHYDGSPRSVSPTTPESVMSLSPSEVSLYGTDIVVEDQRKLIQGLAEHIVHDQNRVSPTMSSHLLALLLLTKHRKGVSMSVLEQDFDWLKQEVINRGHDLGFSGKTVDVVNHALSLFGDSLIKKTPVTKSSGDNKTVTGNSNSSNHNNNRIAMFIEPDVSLPCVFELSYYANVANTVFMLESVIANAVLSVVDREQWVRRDEEEVIVLSQQRLLGAAEVLCNYLKYECIFAPPCIPLDLALNEAFDQFTCAEILRREEDCGEYSDAHERRLAKRLDATLSFIDSDDEDNGLIPDSYYCVNRQDSYCAAKFEFLRCILAPILETYYITACNLVSLLKADCAEEDFIQKVHLQLKERVKSGVATYAESVSLDTLKNAVRSFQHNKVVKCYQVANLRMLSLREQYQHEHNLHDFIEKFEAYRD